MVLKDGTSGGQGKKKRLVPILYTCGVVVQSVSPAKGGSDEPLEPPLDPPLKPCHVGTHWIALVEYSQMSTHLLGFQ